MADQADINIARIPIAGIGGLGMVAAAAAVAITLPQLRWLAIVSLVGGISVGLVLIGARNRRARRATEIGGLILLLAFGVGIWLYTAW